MQIVLFENDWTCCKLSYSQRISWFLFNEICLLTYSDLHLNIGLNLRSSCWFKLKQSNLEILWIQEMLYSCTKWCKQQIKLLLQQKMFLKPISLCTSTDFHKTIHCKPIMICTSQRFKQNICFLFKDLDQGWATPGTRALLFSTWARPRKRDSPISNEKVNNL